MRRYWFRLAAIVAIAVPAGAEISLSIDILDASDGIPLPPTGIAVVDVLVDVDDDDSWTVAATTGRTLNGATIRYATDPNGDIALLDPGLADRNVTFVSRPRGRNADNRFTNGGAAVAGGYSPLQPVATTTATQINVVFFAPPLMPNNSADGAIARFAFNLPPIADFFSLAVFPLENVPPEGAFVPLFRSVGQGTDLGTVTASFDSPAPPLVGLNWVFGYLVPEPSSGLLIALAAAAAFRRRR